MAWTTVVNDTFVRSNTSPGAAGTTTGGGNGWVDLNGSVWSIDTNRLKGAVQALAYDYVLRPAGEVYTNARIVLYAPANQASTAQFWGIVRYQANGNGYGFYRAGNTLFIVNVNGLTQLTTGTISPAYDSTHAYRYTFSASGTSPTTLTLTLYDETTAAEVASLTVNDSTAGLQTSGRYGANASNFGGGATNLFYSRIETFQDDPAPSLVAGTLANTVNGSASVSFSLATNSGGTAPYSSQLQRTTRGGSSWSNVGSPVTGTTATLTDATVAAATSYDYRAVVTDAAAVTANSNTVQVDTPSTNTVAFTDSAFFFSPYNWKATGTSYNESNTPGAYFKVKFSGASAVLNLITSHLTAASVDSDKYPIIEWSVNGGTFNRDQFTSGQTTLTLASGLGSGPHTLEVHFAGVWYQQARWSSLEGTLRITGLTIGSGQSLSAPTIRTGRAILFGDSNGEGYEVLGAGVTVANQSARRAHLAKLADALGAEFGVASFAAQGYGTGGGGGVPSLPNAWNLYWAGASRLTAGLLSPAPDYIVSTHGTNDGGDVPAAIVTPLIAAWRAAAPLAKILICSPPGTTNETASSSGVTAAGDANAYFLNHGENLLASVAWATSPHLNDAGSSRYAARLAFLAGQSSGAASGGAVLSRVRTGF
jgi:hypothetical protein